MTSVPVYQFITAKKVVRPLGYPQMHDYAGSIEILLPTPSYFQRKPGDVHVAYLLAYTVSVRTPPDTCHIL